MDLNQFFIEEQVVKTIREFFYAKKFHEVIAPVFNKAIPIEPNIFPFSTIWNTLSENRELYLASSPERSLKLMLAKGIGNCFSFGKSFRNLENAGSLHSPEFLMLEWYRENAIYPDIMKDIQHLILYVKESFDSHQKKPSTKTLTYQGKTISLEGEWNVYSMVSLFKKYADITLSDVLTDKQFISKARAKGYATENATWSSLFDQIFVNEIEPNMPDEPFFIIDFPARLSPLCKVQSKKPYLADRFEFFMFRIELANGNNENTDYESVRTVFATVTKERQAAGIKTSPVDELFLQALKTMAESGKRYAGVGMGVERLAMILADASTIGDVAFSDTML